MNHGGDEPYVGLGVVGVRELALVDEGGGVSPAGSGWRVRFLVRSDERWHAPAAEASTRQEMSHGMSGVITRARIPGGDVVATVSTSLDGRGRPHARLHIANTTPLPVGIAVVLTAGDLDGSSGVTSVSATVGGIRVGDDQVVTFPRDAGALLAAADDASLEQALLGDQTSSASVSATSARGEAGAAAVFPVAHATSLTVSIALRAGEASAPDQLPDADTVAKGWSAHLSRGVRIVTGDDPVDAALVGARQRLLIAAGDGVPGAWPGEDRESRLHLRGALALALAQWGFDTEAESVRDHLVAELDTGDATTAAAWLLAAEATRSLGGAPAASSDLIALAVGTIDAALRRPRRRPSGTDGLAHIAGAVDPFSVTHSVWSVVGLEAAAAAMVAHHQADAAARLSKRANRLRVAIEAHGGAVAELVQALGPWFCPNDPPIGAAPVLPLDGCDPLDTALGLLSFPRRFVLSHPWGFDVVAPPVPGGNWEIHDLPTPHGSVSVAVRWHGERAALLWEHDGGRLTASSFDPMWSATDTDGEALLFPKSA